MLTWRHNEIEDEYEEEVHVDMDSGEDDEMGGVAFGATEPAPEEYVIYNCKRVQRDVALVRCIASIEAGTGSWKSTNLTKSETFQRRYDTSPGSVRAPIYNPAYTSAYLTDPYYAVHMDGKWHMPDMPHEQLTAAIALVSWAGGPVVERSFKAMVLSGYPESMQTWVEAVAAPQQPAVSPAHAASSSKKHKREEMPSMESRQDVRSKFGGAWPELQATVVRLMACHATACATERNWSLWGRVYTSSRNSLDAERTRKLITICTNSPINSIDSDFAVTLQVVEGDV